VAIDLIREKGVPLDRQESFTWRSMVREPISKLNNDAFTRLRIIPLNGMEMEANRFQHHFARMNRELRGALARSVGTQFVHESQVPPSSPSIAYRSQINSDGPPSETVAAGFRYTPGTELLKRTA
jgi:hypothetical protein